MRIKGYRLFTAGLLERFIVPVKRVRVMYNPDIVTVNIIGDGTALFFCPLLKYEAPELRGGHAKITAHVTKVNPLEQEIKKA